MSTTLKIFLAILIGLVGLCAVAGIGMYLVGRTAGRVIEQAFITDLAQVAAISSKIAVYTLPDGFGEPIAVDAAGYTLVGYTGADGNSHVYFFQLPADVHVNTADMENQARHAIEPGRGVYGEVQVVDRKPGVIAGQDVTLIISEGINHDKQPFREVSAIFAGKGGQALVAFSRPVAAWDDAEMEAFLASIQ